MKTFSTSGTGSGQTLSEIETDKIPIYATDADAEADLVNLSVGQIIGITDTGDELAQPVDVVESGNLHAVSSNAVAEEIKAENVYSYNNKIFVIKMAGVYIFTAQGCTLSQFNDAISSLGITTQEVQIATLSRRDSANNNVYPCSVVLSTSGTANAWFCNAGVENQLGSTDILYGQMVIYKD